jgi:hypothetical protein
VDPFESRGERRPALSGAPAFNLLADGARLMRVSDFGEVIAISQPYDAPSRFWISPASGMTAPQRLLDALRNGEATLGGLAEAGWKPLD